MKRYHLFGIKEIQRMLDAGEVTCTELCAYYLKRIEKFGGKDELNCVCAVNENALSEARASDGRGEKLPLRGCFVLVKDNVDIAGMPTTAGSVALANHIAREDASVIGMLKKLGAVILGKTNLTEFANFLTQGMPGGFSSLGGQVVSAFAQDKPVSGSSSGSAVAMSAGLCSFSVGTDTSFSVVGCAAENGVIGYKPPAGALPSRGIVPITKHFDSPGFFTKSMDDLRIVLSALFGEPQENLPARKLLVNDFRIGEVSENQRALYARLLAKLEVNGTQIAHVEIGNTPLLKELMLRCFARELQDYLDASGERLTVDEILMKYGVNPDLYAPYGTTYLETSIHYMRDGENGTEIAAILADIEKTRAEVLEKLDGADACLMTGPTCVMHYVGLPSLSIPFANGADGYPRSMILFGKDEEKLLAAADEIQRLCGDTAKSEYWEKEI